MRLLPVELTCYASTSELEKVAMPLILRHFPKDPGQPSIKVVSSCEHVLDNLWVTQINQSIRFIL